MTDLFGVEGNLLLDNLTMPAPYKERIASLPTSAMVVCAARWPSAGSVRA